MLWLQAAPRKLTQAFGNTTSGNRPCVIVRWAAISGAQCEGQSSDQMYGGAVEADPRHAIEASAERLDGDCDGEDHEEDGKQARGTGEQERGGLVVEAGEGAGDDHAAEDKEDIHRGFAVGEGAGEPERKRAEGSHVREQHIGGEHAPQPVETRQASHAMPPRRGSVRFGPFRSADPLCERDLRFVFYAAEATAL